MGDYCNQEVPITIVKGASFPLVITYADSTGGPIDLTNYTSYMQVMDTYTASTTLITNPSTANGEITIDGPNGTIAVLISATTTATLTAPGKAFYLLWLTSPDGSIVNRILKGPACIQI